MRLRLIFVVLIAGGCGGSAGADSGFVPTLPASSGARTVLQVSVSGAKGTEGDICVALFGSKDGFPDGANSALQTKCASLASQPVVLEGMTEGATYALSVFVDTNGNARLDTKKFFGVDVPAEGYGFSNNATGSFGPPGWDDAKFVLGPQTANADITLTYF